MLVRMFTVAAIVLFGIFTQPALAEEIESVTMISLAESDNPWTINMESDGRVEWKKSSGGYLADSLFGEKDDGPGRASRISGDDITKLFGMIAQAGYTKKLYHGQEPKIKLIVKLTDGTKIINNGPNRLSSDEEIKSFREIERAMVKAAGFDYNEEVKKYNGSSSAPYIFLYYSVVYRDF